MFSFVSQAALLEAEPQPRVAPCLCLQPRHVARLPNVPNERLFLLLPGEGIEDAQGRQFLVPLDCLLGGNASSVDTGLLLGTLHVVLCERSAGLGRKERVLEVLRWSPLSGLWERWVQWLLLLLGCGQFIVIVHSLPLFGWRR